MSYTLPGPMKCSDRKANVNEKDRGGRHEGVIFNIAMIYTICNMHVYICKPAKKTVTLSNEVEEHSTFFHMI